MKILVLGSKGQLGQCLNDQLANTKHDFVCTSRVQIDIADFKLTKAKILEISPDIVINATAYTAVDDAEEEHQAADLINHLAVENISSICNQLGCWLIHISTDYVFDGNSEVPYKEDNPTNPQGVYGRSKLKGEIAIKASGCKYLIIRTAWVYSEYGNNFLKTMLRLGVDHDELSVVEDQIGCPTYAQDIAKTIVSISSLLNLKESSSGIYHYCGGEPCSWYDFAQAIFLEAEVQGLKIPSHVKSIATVDYPTPAVRPHYSVLDCSSIESCFDVTLSNWRNGIKTAIERSQC
ncbi:dTDP-4-dehydrorhamnose reductase [Gammaproteobacteria bacterium]|nr:dTDP-4-dehydrorhamnose reductase [Gammaproteobacteria bacterium]